MSDQSSQQLAHDNLNTLAEIMMSSISESCCELNNSNAAQLQSEAQTSTAIVKRRRGRPPRLHSNNGGLSVQQSSTAVDEDVCFVCFDGGSLVLCDRRGCPKAYHPACIKRDEAFFQSKAQWNCGWHLCNTCQKASYYMCYTCPFSLCKGCIKDADYVSVRGAKGFCGICLRTIMLIENPAPWSQGTAQVDFDDKGSWEYLFKVYWVNLKGELSLTLDELIQAKNPWKGDESMPQKLVGSSGVPKISNYDKGLQSVNAKRRKIDTQTTALYGEMTINMNKTLRQRNSKQKKERTDPVACQRGNHASNEVDPASAIIHNLGKQLMGTSESSSFLWSTGIGYSESDRIWHYQDPSGKVQGPFSMAQLRKWSISGFFPPGLRIWRLGERQDSSVLLTDVLHRQYNIKLQPSYSSLALSQDIKSAPPAGVTNSVGPHNSSNGVQKGSTNANKSQQRIDYVIGLQCISHDEHRSCKGASPDVVLTSKKGDKHPAKRISSRVAVQKESKHPVGNLNLETSNMGSKCNDYNERVKNNDSDSQSSSHRAVTSAVNVSEQHVLGGNTKQHGHSQEGNDDSLSQSQVSLPVISEKCTPSNQLEGPENESGQPGETNANKYICNIAESQINSRCTIEKQSDGKYCSSQSPEQNREPPNLVSPLEVWDTKSVSAANFNETSEKNDQVSVSGMPNFTAKPSNENLTDQGIDSRQPVSGLHIQDSGKLRKETTGEWNQCSHTSSKPCEDLDCSLVSGSTLKPADTTLRLADTVGDYAATSTSASDQQRYSSESHHASNPSAWQDIVPEPSEFCCLVDESVSDLLAEVEAMESLNANGPGTPTSIMNCGGNLTEGSIDDCFSHGGSFSHVGIFSSPGHEKTDALSIAGDMQLTSQSTAADEANAGYQTNIVDPSKKFDGQFSHSVEADRDARSSDVSVNQLELNVAPVQDNANLSWLNLLKATEPLFVEPLREPRTESS